MQISGSKCAHSTYKIASGTDLTSRKCVECRNK